MKAKELMIGDWVQDLSPVVIDAISNEDICTYQCKDGYITVNPSNLKPIPLTPEILEKNGWERSADHLWRHDDAFSLENDIEKGYWVHLFDSPIIYLTSVHELQHALRLFKIEKEIKL